MRGKFIEVWYGSSLLEESLLNANTSEREFKRKYWTLLNEHEKQKAASFARETLQNKYIKTRAILRRVLASYLNVEPQHISIDTGKHGKPFLSESLLSFNLSHTDDELVIAVGNIGGIGIDIEKVRARKNMAALVKKCFSKQESEYWHTLSEQKRIELFYRFWVRKEAFVKAVGRGLAVGLDQCVVNPINQTGFLSIPIGFGLPSNWKIIDVSVDQDYMCAIVSKETDFEYKLKQLK